MATEYHAEIHVRRPGREDLATYYIDTTGPAGIPAEVIRANAEAEALAQEPGRGSRVVGSRVQTDGARS